MSDTQRTDEILVYHDYKEYDDDLADALVKHARQLERELAACKAIREAEAEGIRRHTLLEKRFGPAAVTHTLQPVGWVVAVEEEGSSMRVYGQPYSTRQAAEQDAALPIARGQRAEVWECRRA